MKVFKVLISALLITQYFVAQGADDSAIYTQLKEIYGRSPDRVLGIESPLENCSNFSGNWVRDTVVEGNPSEPPYEITISQQGCYSIVIQEVYYNAMGHFLPGNVFYYNKSPDNTSIKSSSVWKNENTIAGVFNVTPHVVAIEKVDHWELSLDPKDNMVMHITLEVTMLTFDFQKTTTRFSGTYRKL